MNRIASTCGRSLIAYTTRNDLIDLPKHVYLQIQMSHQFQQAILEIDHQLKILRSPVVGFEASDWDLMRILRYHYESNGYIVDFSADILPMAGKYAMVIYPPEIRSEKAKKPEGLHLALRGRTPAEIEALANIIANNSTGTAASAVGPSLANALRDLNRSQ